LAVARFARRRAGRPVSYRPTAPVTDGVVTLRLFSLEDVAAVTEVCQDPSISEWTSAVPWPYTEDDARRWIAGHGGAWREGTSGSFAIVDATGGHLLGAVGLHDVDRTRREAEIGYWVAASSRGRGVATRAVELATAWGFTNFGLDAMDLLTKFGNEASERVAQKAGYQLMGEIRGVPSALHPTVRFDARRWARTIAGRSPRPWPENFEDRT
jgi:RimJ/RimL family protein N-acetyltransferase